MRGLRKWGRGLRLTQQEVNRRRGSSFPRHANYINDILFKFFLNVYMLLIIVYQLVVTWESELVSPPLKSVSSFSLVFRSVIPGILII